MSLFFERYKKRMLIQVANKPKKEIITGWWKRSIKEGLEKNCRRKNAVFAFRMVHWADFLYAYPVHRKYRYTFDDLYNNEPYIPARKGALKTYNDSWKDAMLSSALGFIGSGIDKIRKRIGMDKLSDWLLEKKLKDLAFYYDEKRFIYSREGKKGRTKDILRNELKKEILAEKGNQLMLIAHSMGSIIAYDVLRDIGRSGENLKVSHFVTIGSPLGFSPVKGKIIDERKYDRRVRTPSIVINSWVNYADRLDPVAIDVTLRDEYKANDRGVRVRDDLVANDYQSSGRNGKRNHHKSYGYLRTPELSVLIKKFLGL